MFEDKLNSLERLIAELIDSHGNLREERSRLLTERKSLRETLAGTKRKLDLLKTTERRPLELKEQVAKLTEEREELRKQCEKLLNRTKALRNAVEELSNGQ